MTERTCTASNAHTPQEQRRRWKFEENAGTLTLNLPWHALPLWVYLLEILGFSHSDACFDCAGVGVVTVWSFSWGKCEIWSRKSYKHHHQHCVELGGKDTNTKTRDEQPKMENFVESFLLSVFRSVKSKEMLGIFVFIINIFNKIGFSSCIIIIIE